MTELQRLFYLGMSVLAGLGGGHLHNFAGASLQHHIPVLTQSRALHRESGGGARLASLEVKVGICHGAMGQGRCKRYPQIITSLSNTENITFAALDHGYSQI